MKTINLLTVIVALTFCLGAKAQKLVSPVYNAAGMVMKQETIIELNDTLATFTDSRLMA